jgi:hypothetical protein
MIEKTLEELFPLLNEKERKIAEDLYQSIKDSYLGRMNNKIDEFINSLEKEFFGLSDGFLERFSEDIGNKLWEQIWKLE